MSTEEKLADALKQLRQVSLALESVALDKEAAELQAEMLKAELDAHVQSSAAKKASSGSSDLNSAPSGPSLASVLEIENRDLRSALLALNKTYTDAVARAKELEDELQALKPELEELRARSFDNDAMPAIIEELTLRNMELSDGLAKATSRTAELEAHLREQSQSASARFLGERTRALALAASHEECNTLKQRLQTSECVVNALEDSNKELEIALQSASAATLSCGECAERLRAIDGLQHRTKMLNDKIADLQKNLLSGGRDLDMETKEKRLYELYVNEILPEPEAAAIKLFCMIKSASLSFLDDEEKDTTTLTIWMAESLTLYAAYLETCPRSELIKIGELALNSQPGLQEFLIFANLESFALYTLPQVVSNLTTFQTNVIPGLPLNSVATVRRWAKAAILEFSLDDSLKEKMPLVLRNKLGKIASTVAENLNTYLRVELDEDVTADSMVRMLLKDQNEKLSKSDDFFALLDERCNKVLLFLTSLEAKPHGDNVTSSWAEKARQSAAAVLSLPHEEAAPCEPSQEACAQCDQQETKIRKLELAVLEQSTEAHDLAVQCRIRDSKLSRLMEQKRIDHNRIDELVALKESQEEFISEIEQNASTLEQELNEMKMRFISEKQQNERLGAHIAAQRNAESNGALLRALEALGDENNRLAATHIANQFNACIPEGTENLMAHVGQMHGLSEAKNVLSARVEDLHLRMMQSLTKSSRSQYTPQDALEYARLMGEMNSLNEEVQAFESQHMASAPHLRQASCRIMPNPGPQPLMCRIKIPTASSSCGTTPRMVFISNPQDWLHLCQCIPFSSQSHGPNFYM